MAEEILDSEFKSNITKLIETVIQKVDGLASDVRTNSFKIDSMEANMSQMDARLGRVEVDLSRLRTDVKTLTGQFNDVGVMAIKDNQRIDTLEQRVGVLEEGVH